MRWGLLRWQCKTAAHALWPAPAALAWAMFSPEPLFRQWAMAGLVIFAHSALIAALLGRSRIEAAGYLYSRGFSRNALWGRTMLAGAALALATWLPAALIIWTGERARIGNWMQSPYQPLMWPREAWMPLWWLAMYAFALPVFHYERIRRAQPFRESDSGAWLVVALLLALASFGNVPITYIRASDLYLGAVTTGALTVALLLLLGGRRLHRRLEAGQ